MPNLCPITEYKLVETVISSDSEEFPSRFAVRASGYATVNKDGFSADSALVITSPSKISQNEFNVEAITAKG